jgi:KDO2-lipid IV(A) lauroyltransferase
MQAISFYLTYPFIYLLASLPFPVLYKVSDVLYFLLRLSGYRRKVVIQNLTNSFPGKGTEEIQKLADEYFRYLCDLTLEVLKTTQMTEEEYRERCLFHNSEWLDKFYDEKRSIIIVMGHYGNWEWAGPAFSLKTRHQLVVVYKPLSNIYFEQMMVKARTKFGTRIVPMVQTMRDMVVNRSKITATALIADQAAWRDSALWTTFLHQDTSVFTGPEKLAIKFNYPVVFMNVKRMRRGYYEVFPELLSAEPKETKPDEISEIFTKRLENEIVSDPVIWLWSHKRWKHKRPLK